MKKKTIIVSIVVSLLVIAMALTLVSNKKEIDRNKETKTSAVTIAVAIVTPEMNETKGHLDLVGAVQASKEVNVASEGAGKVVQVNFKLGEFVAKGKVLVKIEDTYKRLAYENAKLTYNKAKDDYERNVVLSKGNAISDTQLRDVKMAYDNATIQLQSAKKQWDDMKVIAPFSGYITSQNIELGSYVNPASVIAGLADIAELKVVLDVSESDAYLLRQGQHVNVTADVQPNADFKGKISNISPKASTAHTYPVEILIANNGKYKLKAGTFVNVGVDLGASGKVMMIPRKAILSSVKEPSVYVVVNNTTKLVKITTGRSFESNVEVLEGLSKADKVVTEGQINLNEGSKVSIIN